MLFLTLHPILLGKQAKKAHVLFCYFKEKAVGLSEFLQLGEKK